MKSSKGFAALEALKNEMENQRRIENEKYVKEMWERRNKLMEKVGFVTPEEMIDYLTNGGLITDREGQYFSFENGIVEMIYEIYDEGAGPQGFGKKYQTLAQFKKFVYGTLNENKDGEWMPIWVKEEEYDF